jgi:hypothetical protein
MYGKNVPYFSVVSLLARADCILSGTLSKAAGLLGAIKSSFSKVFPEFHFCAWAVDVTVGLTTADS